jgi:hypothetical protein
LHEFRCHLSVTDDLCEEACEASRVLAVERGPIGAHGGGALVHLGGFQQFVMTYNAWAIEKGAVIRDHLAAASDETRATRGVEPDDEHLHRLGRAFRQTTTIGVLRGARAGVEAPLARAGRASEGDTDCLGGRQHELIPLVPLLDLGLLIRRCVTDRRIPATPTVAIPSAATPTATNLRITQTKCDQP